MILPKRLRRVMNCDCKNLNVIGVKHLPLVIKAKIGCLHSIYANRFFGTSGLKMLMVLG